MGAAEIITLVNGLLSIAFRLYESIDQIERKTPIPTWEELLAKNAALQAKIDAEKAKP